MKKGLTALLIMILLGITGCEGAKKENLSSPKMPLISHKTESLPERTFPPQPAVTPLEGQDLAGPLYNPRGKPDPFEPTTIIPKGRYKVLPLEQYDANEFVLVSIVAGPGIRRAMVQDPTGKGFIIQAGTRIGKRGGRVIRIAGKEVVIEELFRDFLGRKSLRKIFLKIPQTL
jgi:type IV pilus assembly protein PilP